MSGLSLDVREKRFAGVGAAPAVRVLADVALSVAAGEFVALVGPSGSGKTTLLNIAAGLDDDYEGERRLEPGDGHAPARIGYVFQNPRLLPWRTVYENVELVLPRGGDPAIIERLLDDMGIAAARHVYPPRLSVGMSRRVALARALAIAPDFLLMDEPFVSLDEPTAARLRRLVLAAWRSRPCGVLFVTHDVREALFLADRLLLMCAAPGRIVGEFVVPLERAARVDARAIEALKDELERRFPSLDRGAAATSASRDTR
jgi:NitT/TauT family transport system ATP-binding protein